MEPQSELKRVLSFPVLLLIAINSIMGTGIFFLPAFGASKAGPASLISWSLLSIIAIYISMCFAELAGMYPSAGGIYEYCKQAFGRFPSFLIGWMTVLAGNITIAMLIVGAIVYLIPGDTSSLEVKGVILAVSIIFILIFNYIAYRGMKISSVMLITFAIITLTTLLMLVFPGLLQFKSDNFTPFFVFPTSAIFLTVFFIAETFFGWETTTFLAEETKDAKNVLPKVLIYSTIIIAFICLIFVTISIASVPVSDWSGYPIDRPLANLAESLGFPGFAQDIITMMVYLSIIGSVAGWIVAAPRLILALCRDKVFPGHLKTIHPKYGTPHKAILFQTVLSSFLVFIGIGAYLTLLQLLLPIALFLYALVILSLVILRFKQPDIERPYKQPLGIIGPIILILILLGLIVNYIIIEHNAIYTFFLVVSLIIMGVPIYFLIEMYYDPKAIRKVSDSLAYLTLLSEFIFIPKKIVSHGISLLGNIKGNTVLEFGCSVGTITGDLARDIGKDGRLYATDISLHELKITKKRLDKLGISNVRLIHDKLHASRVHPIIPNVDAVISMGMLSYVQDIHKVLKEIYHRLDKDAKFCFVDYGKFFHLIPNVEWITSDSEIKKFFTEAGFSVSIQRKRSLMFEYVFIHGIKGKEIKYI